MRSISSSGVRCSSSALAPRLSLVGSLRCLAQRYTSCEYLVLAAHGQAAWVLEDAAAVRAADVALARAANPCEWRAAALCRRFSQACVALLDERLDEARGLLEPLAQGPNRVTYFQADLARVLLSDVLLRQGRLDEAARRLQPCLDAARSGQVGGLLLAGRTVLRRLAQADWGGRVDARMLLPLADGLRAPPAAEGADVTLPPLSEREREVLALIARGDSNKLIARTFSLSPHTVKRHVANILDKLGVDTRGQAAARWRDAVR